MYNKNSIFDYYDSNSIIHRLNPVYKIISVLFVFLCIFFANSTIDYVVVSFLVIMVVLFSDINIRIYLNDIKYFYVFIILLFIIGFISSGVVNGFIYSIKFIYLYLYMSTITMSCSFNSIVYAMERILKPFNVIINVSYLSLRIGLIIKFISIMYNERIRIRNSRLLRGFKVYNIGFFERIKFNLSNFIPVFSSSMDKIHRLENVMQVRNYGVYDIRNNYRLNKFGKIDTILLGINVVVLILIFLY